MPYPEGWPRCPKCGDFALDGHITCGRLECNEHQTRRDRARPELTADECDLLEWLAGEDYSQYGECYGATLDSLVAKGLAQVHGPGEHQVFIANGTGQMYRAVSLTAAGVAAIRKE